jgi:hypothetical protein
MTIAVLLDVALGGSAVLAQIGKRVTPFLSAPLMIIPLAFLKNWVGAAMCWIGCKQGGML